MNKFSFGIALTALMLGACSKPADPVAPETAAATPAPADEATPAATEPAVTEPAVPAPVAAAPVAPDSEAAAPAATSDADMDKAIDAALGDHAAYRKVMEDFQKAVAAKDAKAASVLVHYPIGVDIAGKNKVLKNAAAFVENYDKFMTPEIARAIIDTRYAEAFVNYKGVMLGRGEAWINGICKDNACKNVDVKVVTIQSTADLSP
ncbi:MAG: hypothetical protein ABWX88_00315 [Pseudoxanthomonas sp.]